MYHCVVKPYRRLDAWRACHELVLAVYRITTKFPQSELYGLTSQTRRAAMSASLNIAEGSAKRGPREFRRYLDIALGSLSELSYAIMLARDLDYLSDDEWKSIEAVSDDAGKLTWGLYEPMARRT